MPNLSFICLSHNTQQSLLEADYCGPKGWPTLVKVWGSLLLEGSSVVA